jgi:ABC-2 type transport system permease protein
MNNKNKLTGSQTQPYKQTNFDRIIDNTFVMVYGVLLKMLRTPEQFIDVTIQPIVFILMFSYVFGGAIAGNVRNYLPFLIPGILVQTLIGSSMVTGTQLRDDMDKGVFDRFRSLPITRIAPLAGSVIADIIRYAIATTITFATGIIIGFKPYGGVFGVLSAGLLVIFVSWSISWIFAYIGVIANSAESLQGISFLILMPLTFLSNAFAPINSFPKIMRWIANANPITHVVSAARQLTNHGTICTDFWLALLGSFLIISIFAPLTLNAYMKKT